VTNYERVAKGMELLKAGLAPFVSREMARAVDNKNFSYQKLRTFVEDPILEGKTVLEWDAAALLRVIVELWYDIFREKLGIFEKNLAHELREWRNRWAHQEKFSGDDVDRALDSMGRLLSAVSAPQADEVEKLRFELSRIRFEEQVRGEKRKIENISGNVSTGLRPWREIAIPHEDVASGKYQQAEFAADLWQVHLEKADVEYQDPIEFFRRTYLTESLKTLLVGAVKRLSTGNGDPVVQLQTNFGGGKTHSLLALYHLFSNLSATALPDIEPVLKSANLSLPRNVKKAVLVGTKISPGNPSKKPDGTLVRTWWGELAWQLGGREAFELVRNDDEKGTNPGDPLRSLFDRYGPCLILIDEWVAYARQLHNKEGVLPAGTFETQFTFAQSLTESATGSKNTLLVVSLPASDSDLEAGGEKGKEALYRLGHVVGRLAAPWRPASMEEGFEIVRRRLFQPFSHPKQFTDRDVTAKLLWEWYQKHSTEFPEECNKSAYLQKIKNSYPIHPEVFERLYQDWSTLPKFQRTRGVLRFLATVLHRLWQSGDPAPLILPAHIPVGDEQIQPELMRYLQDNWSPIIDAEVDGPNSLPSKMDKDFKSFGVVHAFKRVARTVYLGSAPIQEAAHRGIEVKRVQLGCTLPGNSPSLFGDALHRLTASATYLYQGGSRYWYSIQPTLSKLAEERAENLKKEPNAVLHELGGWIKKVIFAAEELQKIDVFPNSGADVPDERQVRLVVLSPEHPHHQALATNLYSKIHQKKTIDIAEEIATGILKSRGNTPRLYQNMLIFLAADDRRAPELEEAVRRHLAWSSIVDDKEKLDLSTSQVAQVEQQRKFAKETIEFRISETYLHLLIPYQENPKGTFFLDCVPLNPGKDPITRRIKEALEKSSRCIRSISPKILRERMDEIPLWAGDHVEIEKLIEYFASYLYLDRFLIPDKALLKAVDDGLKGWSFFAFADSLDSAKGYYQNLQERRGLPETQGLLVKPEVARQQSEKEKKPLLQIVEKEQKYQDIVSSEKRTPPPKPLTQFDGLAHLNPEQITKEVIKIAEEIIAHLASTPGAEVSIMLGISAKSLSGFSEETVRTVKENSRTLKLRSYRFDSGKEE